MPGSESLDGAVALERALPRARVIDDGLRIRLEIVPKRESTLK